MQQQQIEVQRANGKTVHLSIGVADSFWTRFLGLMGRSRMPTEMDGLLLTHTKQIHMFFMKFPINTYHLDGRGRVVGIEHAVSPGRIGRRVLTTEHILEVPSDRLLPIALGDRLCLPQ